MSSFGWPSCLAGFVFRFIEFVEVEMEEDGENSGNWWNWLRPGGISLPGFEEAGSGQRKAERAQTRGRWGSNWDGWKVGRWEFIKKK